MKVILPARKQFQSNLSEYRVVQNTVAKGRHNFCLSFLFGYDINQEQLSDVEDGVI
jgi:hypothetical protein